MKLTSYNQFASDLRHESVRTAVEHARRMGFEWVESLDVAPAGKRTPLYEKYDADECRRALHDGGLRVACHSVALDRCDRREEELLDCMYREIDFAARIGSPYFHHTLVLSLKPLSDPMTYEQMLEAVLPNAQKIAARCREYGLGCLYEPQGLFFNGVDGVRGLLDAMRQDYDNVGVCMDLGNSMFVDVPPLEVVRALGEWTRHVHVKDYLSCPSPMEGREGYFSRGGRWLSECALGEGACELSACLDVLRHLGYDGAVSLEVNGDDASVRRAMEWVKAHV